MPQSTYSELSYPARRLRVDTLVRLRWLAVTGQMAALLIVHFGFGFPLPLVPCVVVIASSGLLNVWLRFRFGISHRLADQPAMVQLSYDILQLSVLLYLTGGLENPFAMLFLAPVMISAASLTPSWTFGLVTLTCLAATVLVYVHLPLPWWPEEALHLPFLFTVGVWGAILSGASFIGFYASRIAEEARKLADALAATELVLAREQHLTQLDGIAAAAAHELGTPLATISVVAKDLLTAAATPGSALSPAAIHDDLVLLDQEVRRCRTILGKLASLGNDTGPLTTMTLSHLVADVVEPLRHFGVSVTFASEGSGEEPVAVRNPGMLYGLGNLVENAVDFAVHEVRIALAWSRERVSVCIRDDGRGFSSEVLARLGEPYVTTRGPERRTKSEEGAGLGLGLFIAKTLLERSGATLGMGNAAAPESGAVVTVSWPRSQFEKGLDTRNPATAPYFDF